VLLEQVRGVPASLVDVDNVDASRRAVEYLIGLGHTRIAHFAGPGYSMHSLERIDGVRRAYSASHLVFTEDDIVPAGAHLADGYRAGLAYFGARAPQERPTAVTCYNDLVAIGLCRALSELGLRVPDDVSVVGYDDVPLTEYLPVALTTVRMPKYRMGELAAQMLIRHVESKAGVPLQKVFLDAELVVRASTRMLEGGGRRAEAGGRIRAASKHVAREDGRADGRQGGKRDGRRNGSRSSPRDARPAARR
jgi:LacI family transcriptional regulator/LacI family repressor for deo operon, udp, cdd, tsx, nupC, and nupG